MACHVPSLQLVREGALRSYLKKNKDRITIPMQLTYLMQIATGMAYLEDNAIVHRDLAARNVLVATDKLVPCCGCIPPPAVALSAIRGFYLFNP